MGPPLDDELDEDEKMYVVSVLVFVLVDLEVATQSAHGSWSSPVGAGPKTVVNLV